MGTTTNKLKLNKPYESDYFDIGHFNDNFDIIDNLTHIVASGYVESTKYAVNSPSTVADGIFGWRYQKFDDGTFVASGYYKTTNLRCNDQSTADGSYYSGYIRVNLPSIGITSIYDKQLSLQTNGMELSGDVSTWRFNWAIDCTPPDSVYSFIDTRIIGLANEGSAEQLEKTMYISIRGTWK